ncbi:MAG: ATP-binding cassette domain-containing protein [Thermoanaerobaculia bacterium]
MTRRDPILEAVEAGKSYPGDVLALDGASLAVGQGETVALIGESGSGKTTLLRMFNRMVEPSRGAIRFCGESIGEIEPVALRRRIGYVPQQGGLIPHWTVRRNVELVPRLLGTSETERRSKGAATLDLVGLDPDEVGQRYPNQLSGGQRQRVALARALAADPEVVLLDEPFGALDAITRLELRGEFHRLQAETSLTALLVTHDLGEALELADRIAVMRQGRILQTASAREIAERPADGYVTELLSHVARPGQPEGAK